jgi:hypothetical protein
MSEYATSALALANIILEIFLTAQRLALVTRTPFFIKKVKVKTVCLSILAGSFLAHGPLLFINKIQSVRDSNKTVDYQFAKNDFGKHNMGRATVIILTGTRIILVTIVLLVLSIISVIKFYQFYMQKTEAKSIICKKICLIHTVVPRLFSQGFNQSSKSLVTCCLAILQAKHVKFISNVRNQQFYSLKKNQTYSS